MIKCVEHQVHSNLNQIKIMETQKEKNRKIMCSRKMKLTASFFKQKTIKMIPQTCQKWIWSWCEFDILDMILQGQGISFGLFWWPKAKFCSCKCLQM